MVVPVPSRHLHADAEQLRQPLNLQDFFLRPVSHDSSPAQKNYALNLRNNVGQFVSDQNDCGPRIASVLIVCRKFCWAARSSELQGSSKSSARGLCTRARAISTRRASPDDISQTGRSARCEIFNSESAASANSLARHRPHDSERC